jgi:hypothetical protein
VWSTLTQLVGVRVGRGFNSAAVNHAEDRRVRADAIASVTAATVVNIGTAATAGRVTESHSWGRRRPAKFALTGICEEITNRRDRREREKNIESSQRSPASLR